MLVYLTIYSSNYMFLPQSIDLRFLLSALNDTICCNYVNEMTLFCSILSVYTVFSLMVQCYMYSIDYGVFLY